jgi:hypothetical protein
MPEFQIIFACGKRSPSANSCASRRAHKDSDSYESKTSGCIIERGVGLGKKRERG